MHWWAIAGIGVGGVTACFVCFVLGFVRGRKVQRREVVKTFDDILQKLCALAAEEKWSELNYFLHDACGKPMSKPKKLVKTLRGRKVGKPDDGAEI